MCPGTIVANITAEDPDDEGFPGRLLYSITTVSSYFVIDQRESSTASYPSLLMLPLEWFVMLSSSLALGLPFSPGSAFVVRERM